MSDHKAESLAREIADVLQIRLSALAMSQSFDTDSYPLIKIGTGSAGDPNILIKVLPVSRPLAKDVLGLADLTFNPHIIQFATEADPTGGSGANILTPQQLLYGLGECLGKGCKVEWYQSANGVAPVVGTLISGNLKGTFWSVLNNPMASAQ